MATFKTAGPVPVAKRIGRFSHAIRNIVSHARAVEALGMRVRYLNIGDPVAFGYAPPPHLVEATARAMRDGHSGYLPSAGILEARQAAAGDHQARDVPVTPDRVLITSGTGEGIDVALTSLVDEGDEVLVQTPTYPLYPALLATLSARPVYYRTEDCLARVG
jgi:alanine-synthesizing transaminase